MVLARNMQDDRSSKGTLSFNTQAMFNDGLMNVINSLWSHARGLEVLEQLEEVPDEGHLSV